MDAVIAGLVALRDQEAREGQRFKAAAYAKVVQGLLARQARGEPLQCIDDLAAVPGVGASIRQKIAQLLAGVPPPLHPPSDLLQVHGIGPAKAKALQQSGVRSVADLRAAVAAGRTALSSAQTAGLRHCEDLQLRIPRAEMASHEATLREALLQSHPRFQLAIVGSYRRGAPDSGDIDALVTLPAPHGSQSAAEHLQVAIATMARQGYIIEALASGAKKFMGIVRQHGGPARRLDVLLAPPEQHAFALLYFTGSDAYNVAVRKAALARGYSLNEHGLTPLRRRDGQAAAEPPPLPNEAAILDFLGLPYVAPEDRR
jgi:DNA polymerase/3'-5' exonuclease PolX